MQDALVGLKRGELPPPAKLGSFADIQAAVGFEVCFVCICAPASPCFGLPQRRETYHQLPTQRTPLLTLHPIAAGVFRRERPLRDRRACLGGRRGGRRRSGGRQRQQRQRRQQRQQRRRRARRRRGGRGGAGRRERGRAGGRAAAGGRRRRRRRRRRGRLGGAQAQQGACGDGVGEYDFCSSRLSSHAERAGRHRPCSSSTSTANKQRQTTANMPTKNTQTNANKQRNNSSCASASSTRAPTSRSSRRASPRRSSARSRRWCRR